MENKTTKFLLKLLMLFPIGFILFFAFSGFNTTNWVFAVITGLVSSFGIVFNNLFDYEKYDEITYQDFLESTHTKFLENKGDNWKLVTQVMKNQFTNSKTLEFNSSFIKIEIERKYISSIITATLTPEKIILKIERKYLKFLPDNTSNYKALNKMVKNIDLSVKNLIFKVK